MATGSRTFSTTIPTRVEDAAGPGGPQKDAFSKREKANEDKYVRDQEMAKLRALREKLENQHKDIGNMLKSIDDMSSDGNPGKKQ